MYSLFFSFFSFFSFFLVVLYVCLVNISTTHDPLTKNNKGINGYITALQSLCAGTELRTQAEAALVLVHVVVNADEGLVSDMNGIVRGLLDLCQSEHPTVRSRAVHMVGVLIGRTN